jgi:hypothetical protein
VAVQFNLGHVVVPGVEVFHAGPGRRVDNDSPQMNADKNGFSRGQNMNFIQCSVHACLSVAN